MKAEKNMKYAFDSILTGEDICSGISGFKKLIRFHTFGIAMD